MMQAVIIHGPQGCGKTAYDTKSALERQINEVSA